MQCPTLQRLPVGLEFSDDGALHGTIAYDPLRPEVYSVDFVAISAAQWDEPSIGLIRLNISMRIESNVPQEPAHYVLQQRTVKEHQVASAVALRTVQECFGVYEVWERRGLTMQETVDNMLSHLQKLQSLLEKHPQLDGGRWWVFLGGLHMNVHKLMENVLFECELYLGYALMFGDPEVRCAAEQNLEGCYKKRELEAAKFMWMDGLSRLLQSQWSGARSILDHAAAKQDGWGWGVNFGEIWIAAASARILEVASLQRGRGQGNSNNAAPSDDVKALLAEALSLMEQARARRADHPWLGYNTAALDAYRNLLRQGQDTSEWQREFTERTAGWCSEILTLVQPKQRRESAMSVAQRLPVHAAV